MSDRSSVNKEVAGICDYYLEVDLGKWRNKRDEFVFNRRVRERAGLGA